LSGDHKSGENITQGDSPEDGPGTTPENLAQGWVLRTGTLSAVYSQDGLTLTGSKFTD